MPSNGLSQSQAYAIDLQLAKSSESAIAAIGRGEPSEISPSA
jgi:hypothetical protein